jgi:hypothetical protein
MNRTITLPRDLRRWVSNKEVLYKKGTVLEITVEEYDRLMAAVVNDRIALRNKAAQVPGSPEWKAAHDL